MHFGFSEEELLLQSTLRDFLSKECPPTFVRGQWQSETGRSEKLWKRLAELGVTGVLVSEENGGLGMDEVALVLLLEETGRAALAEPLVSTSAVAAPMLRELERTDLAKLWLEGIAKGDAVVAVGHSANAFLSDAHVAKLLLLPHDDEVHAIAPSDAKLTHQPANDPARRIYSVAWQPRPETCVARGRRAIALQEAAFDRGALACAAQALGVAEQLIDLSVAYASQRHQFGKPIGAFQAIQHMLANVKVQLEYARPLVHRAAHSVARGTAQRGLHVSMAKLSACKAATSAAGTALQVHGAIGYTWEQDLHIWMRRAWSLDLSWGRRDLHEGHVRRAILEDRVPLGPGTTFAGDQ